MTEANETSAAPGLVLAAEEIVGEVADSEVRLPTFPLAPLVSIQLEICFSASLTNSKPGGLSRGCSEIEGSRVE